MNEDFDINSFKTKVITTILGNNEIIYMLDKDYIDCGGGLLYKRLFPFLKNPKTVEDSSPFICFKVDHVRNKDVYFEEIKVVIYVICHEKEMSKKVQSYKTRKYVSGNIIDVLTEEIKENLNGLDTCCLGKLSCDSNVEDVLHYDYPYRMLTFSALKENYVDNQRCDL